MVSILFVLIANEILFKLLFKKMFKRTYKKIILPTCIYIKKLQEIKLYPTLIDLI